MNSFSSGWMGAYAREALKEPAIGKIIGVTSSGIFLLVQKRSIFITPRVQKSPFNIFLNEGNSFYKSLSIGEESSCGPDAIVFPAAGLSIDLTTAVIWTPHAPARMDTTPQIRLDRVKEISSALRQGVKADTGFLYLTEAPETDETMRKVALLKRGYHAGDLELCLQASEGLIGLGGGLTPSGDDFLAGFLLYQARMDQATGHERPFTQAFGAALVELAGRKTTWISVSRIEAACRGWSEEVFIDILDHLFNEATSLPEDVITKLMKFGHSSGVDTAVGICSGINL
jgi:hypothetical protein